MATVKALGEHEVWLLTGSQDLYGEAALAQVAEVGQPMGSAIYFAVDYNATIGDIEGFRVAMQREELAPCGARGAPCVPRSPRQHCGKVIGAIADRP